MPGISSTRRRLALLALAGTLLAACSSAPKPPPPTIVSASFVAAPDLNPDSSGRPSPLVVRVYELKALSAFNDADFFSLWDGDQKVLAADLNAREEMVLRPGDSNAMTRNTKAETRFIGVVAGYRDLERAAWRASVAVVPNQTQTITVRFNDRAVSIEAGK